jgi:hypothetical protein
MLGIIVIFVIIFLTFSVISLFFTSERLMRLASTFFVTDIFVVYRFTLWLFRLVFRDCGAATLRILGGGGKRRKIYRRRYRFTLSFSSSFFEIAERVPYKGVSEEEERGGGFTALRNSGSDSVPPLCF